MELEISVTLNHSIAIHETAARPEGMYYACAPYFGLSFEKEALSASSFGEEKSRRRRTSQPSTKENTTSDDINILWQQ